MSQISCQVARANIALNKSRKDKGYNWFVFFKRKLFHLENSPEHKK